jgi:hypothetical protein
VAGKARAGDAGFGDAGFGEVGFGDAGLPEAGAGAGAGAGAATQGYLSSQRAILSRMSLMSTSLCTDPGFPHRRRKFQRNRRDLKTAWIAASFGLDTWAENNVRYKKFQVKKNGGIDGQYYSPDGFPTCPSPRLSSSPGLKQSLSLNR